jgi:hypothetical protein
MVRPFRVALRTTFDGRFHGRYSEIGLGAAIRFLITFVFAIGYI